MIVPSKKARKSGNRSSTRTMSSAAMFSLAVKAVCFLAFLGFANATEEIGGKAIEDYLEEMGIFDTGASAPAEVTKVRKRMECNGTTAESVFLS